MRRSIMLAALCLGPATGAMAATLHAGPGQTFALPSQAIAAAHDGDTIAIHPGQYFDCAVVRRNDLTIEGVGGSVVLTDKPCQGKALLVIDGRNVTVRDLTLQRVRVPDHNGAGIRAEGGDLTIENTRFINNQNGLLAAGNQAATIRITAARSSATAPARGFARTASMSTRSSCSTSSAPASSTRMRAITSSRARCPPGSSIATSRTDRTAPPAT